MKTMKIFAIAMLIVLSPAIIVVGNHAIKWQNPESQYSIIKSLNKINHADQDSVSETIAFWVDVDGHQHKTTLIYLKNKEHRMVSMEEIEPIQCINLLEHLSTSKEVIIKHISIGNQQLTPTDKKDILKIEKFCAYDNNGKLIKYVKDMKITFLSK